MLILHASIYPGQLSHALFWVKFFVLVLVVPPLGLLVVPAILWGIWQSRDWLFSIHSCSKRLALAAPVMASMTWAVVQFDVPQTLAFRVSQPAFEKALDSVPDSVTPVNKRIGLYRVQRSSLDSRGGAYFHVTSGEVGLDMISHGFVYKPNRHGSPFGTIHYSLKHLTGDWYVFSDTSTLHLF